MRKRVAIPVVIGIVAVACAGAAWLYRTPIASYYIDQTLERSGVVASYDVDRIGWRQQRLRNVVIGDPDRPDLTVDLIDIDVAMGLAGPKLTAIRARNVRLRATTDGQRVTMGAIDRLLPADDGTPMVLPDVALSLHNARILLSTPWGGVGIAGSVEGNPAATLTGAVSLATPRLGADQPLGGCESRDMSGRAQIGVDDGVLAFSGPVRLAELACRNADIELAGAAVTLDGSVPLRQPGLWQLGANFSSATGRVAGAEAAVLQGGLTARGQTRGRAAAQWRISGRGGAMAAATADAFFVTGAGLRDVSGTIAVEGDVRLQGLSAERNVSPWIGNLAAMDDAQPFGPIARALATAVRASVRQMDVTAQYSVRSDSRATGDGMVSAALGEVAAVAPNGARLALNGPQAILWDGKRGWRINGDVAVGGGGLPTGTLRLATAASGGVSGTALFAPYRAGPSIVTMAPTRFALSPAGDATVIGGLAISGPILGGHVEHLTVPVALYRKGRAWAMTDRCLPIRWQAMTLGGVAVNTAGLSLCGDAGRGITTGGAVRIPDLALDLSGDDLRMRVAASNITLDLGRGSFAIRDVRVASPMLDDTAGFRIRALAGRATVSGWAGTAEGVSGGLARVPVDVSDARGAWQWRGSALTATTSLTISDRERDARFEPLVSDGATLTYAEGQIALTGLLHERATRTPVADVRITHRIDEGSGAALFTMQPLRFVQGGLQPVTLSRLPLGVVADVDGTVTGSGAFRWTADGLTSEGSFATEAMNLAAAFGPVRGMSGTIRFNDLVNLSTPPAQQVRLASVNPGIEVLDGEVRYQLLPGLRTRIEGGAWPFAGGVLRLQPALLDFEAETARRLTFDVSGVDAGLFLQRYQFDNITASGVFDGMLPTVFDGDGGRVEGGFLTTRAGGDLAYVGELTNRDLGVFANMAFGALKAIKYDSLTVRMNGRIDGEMLTEVGFSGLAQGDTVENNILTRGLRRLPFTFSIRINAPFRQLLTSARGLYDPTLLIEQNLPALLRIERESASRPAPAAPVQDGESQPRLDNRNDQ